MLETITIDQFAGRVGERFGITAGDETRELTLVECEKLGGGELDRVPFSLVFLGPTEPVLPQAIYPLRHEELGELEIFLVPIGQDADGTQYQAVFT